MSSLRLFALSDDKMAEVAKRDFALESEMQKVVEANLDLLFGLQFVRSEMTIQNLRMDTLAFDTESKAFVIIEFKRGTNFSVVDQGMAYLSAMLGNKAEFVLEYQERLGQPLKKADVDWSQSRVIFVAPSFTNYQTKATNFRDLPIALYEVRRFANDSLLMRRLGDEGTESSPPAVPIDKKTQGVLKEVEVMDLEKLIPESWTVTREVASELVQQLQNVWSDVEIAYKRRYFSYRLPGGTRWYLHPQKKGIAVYFRLPPEKLPPSTLEFQQAGDQWKAVL